jgi:hypothetical protein
MAQVKLPQHDLVGQLPEEPQGLVGGIVENVVFPALSKQKDGDFLFEAA